MFAKRIDAGDARAAILISRSPAEALSRRTAEIDQFFTPYSISFPKVRWTGAQLIWVPT